MSKPTPEEILLHNCAELLSQALKTSQYVAKGDPKFLGEVEHRYIKRRLDFRLSIVAPHAGDGVAVLLEHVDPQTGESVQTLLELTGVQPGTGKGH